MHKHLDQRQHINLFKLELRKEFVCERQNLERDVRTYDDIRRGYSRDGSGL